MTTKSGILKIIKNKCKDDCCTGDKESWINCLITNCVLFPYRFGRDPSPSRKGYATKDTSKKPRVESQKQSKTDIVEDISTQKEEKEYYVNKNN